MESAVNAKRGSAIRDEAAEWLLARQEGLSPEKLRQFSRWLAMSPEHLAEYHAMEQLDRELPLIAKSGATVDELAQSARAPDIAIDNVRPFPSGGHGRQVRARPQFGPPLAMAAAVAFLAIGMTMVWPPLHDYFNPQARVLHYAAMHGQLLVQPLEDGSVLTLDTDSAAEVRYTRKARQVQLVQGRALFEVVHDTNRPFEVLAGAAKIVDVGTRFDVYLRSDATQITVLEGRVEVSGAGVAGVQSLGANEQIRVLASQLPAAPSVVDADAVASYVQGQIVFEHQPLAEVIGEFNRYTDIKIVIATPSLGRILVSGSVPTSDIGLMLDYLRSLDGVRVKVDGNQVQVSKI
jgi:transmembrane sensor